MDSQYLYDRLEAAKTLVTNLEAAFAALAAGESEYSLQTGQTTVRVTHATMTEHLNNYRVALGLVAQLESMLSGGGITYGR